MYTVPNPKAYLFDVITLEAERYSLEGIHWKVLKGIQCGMAVLLETWFMVIFLVPRTIPKTTNVRISDIMNQKYEYFIVEVWKREIIDNELSKLPYQPFKDRIGKYINKGNCVLQLKTSVVFRHGTTKPHSPVYTVCLKCGLKDCPLEVTVKMYNNGCGHDLADHYKVRIYPRGKSNYGEAKSNCDACVQCELLQEPSLVLLNCKR